MCLFFDARLFTAAYEDRFDGPHTITKDDIENAPLVDSNRWRRVTITKKWGSSATYNFYFHFQKIPDVAGGGYNMMVTSLSSSTSNWGAYTYDSKYLGN